MKKIFEIEYEDGLGANWMNEDNLLLCLNAYCKNTEFKVKALDIPDQEGVY